MDSIAQWRNDTLGARTVEALEKNRFTAQYFAGRQDAVAHIVSLIPTGGSVGIGGSRTERTLELGEKCAELGCIVYDHGKEGLSAEERNRIRRSQLTADIFLCSANAITLKGELVNRDGVGNRVAAMIYGPKKVIVVAGMNKVVKDLDEAERRIKLVAAPMNNKRLNMPNPCVSLGECADCRNETRICNITTIISRRPSLTDFHVILVGEELGF